MEEQDRNTIRTTTRIVKRTPPQSGANQRRLNWPYVLLSLVIGTLLWFGVDTKRMKDVVFDIEVAYDALLPAGWKFVVPPVRTARVTLRGPNQEVSSLRKEEISLQPEYPKAALEGDSYDGGLALLPAHFKDLPPQVEVLAINPPMVPIRLVKIITRFVTVQAGDIVGAPEPGYEFGRVVSIDPPAMSVAASREFLSRLGSADAIRTAPFSVDGGKGRVSNMVGLMPLEKDGEVVEVPGQVYMTVLLEEIPAEHEFEQPFEVRALVDSPFDRYGKLKLSPPSVKVTVSGPKAAVDRLNPSEILIYADMRDRIPAAAGEFNIKCKAIPPPSIRVVRIEPDTVKWITSDGGGDVLSGRR